jgi:hypothetical protein
MINGIKRVIGGIGNMFTKRDIENINPNYKIFDDIENNNNSLQYSVIDSAFDDSTQSLLGHEAVNAYKDMVYGSISTDKPKRLMFYRNMSQFPEVSDAIDEIADECLNFDDNHNFINIEYHKNSNLDDGQKKQIQKEFDNFISLFQVEDHYFDYFRSLIIDGEITWENIVSEKNKDMGIIGIQQILPETYEYLLDDRYRIVGIVFNARMAKGEGGTAPTINSGSQNTTDYFKPLNLQPIYSQRDEGKDMIPMPLSQITHIDSGSYSNDKTIVFPILEKARRAYRQLSLLEDSIIIYRLVRAPERLVFNIDTGKLPTSKAEELVYKMMRRYQSKKVYDPTTGDVTSDYDAHQMLESYWFPKPEGSEGTSVDTLGGGANLGELEDLKYFLRKLYISLKIPYDRYENPTSQYEKGIEGSINYEEYRFSKFIMRIQNRFASGIMDSFKTHLKLRGFWDKYNLKERSFGLRMVPPSQYDLYVEQRLLQSKFETYDIVASHEEFSTELAQRKILKMSEEEIKENHEKLEKEKLREAYIERKQDNIRDHGSPEELPENQDGGGW